MTALYFHIPFCRFMCHYCDFAKTANWNQDLVTDYFKSLNENLLFWQKKSEWAPLEKPPESVFFGGGTPSLFTKDYESLFAKMDLPRDCEVSMEINL